MAADNLFDLKIITPDRVFYSGKASFLELNTVEGGFMEILGDRITILAEIAEWPDEIDRNRAQEAKIRAERRLQNDKSNINITRAELALHKALVRIELADHVTK